MMMLKNTIENFKEFVGTNKFTTILADPPWAWAKNFVSYPVLHTKDLVQIPVNEAASDNAHLYLWVCNSNLEEGLALMKAWGFTYKSYVVWVKTTYKGIPDAASLGFNFRNASEIMLFGKKGSLLTSKVAKSTTNVLQVRRRENSRKPEESYHFIEKCSPGPYLELFARGGRPGWNSWGDQSAVYTPETFGKLNDSDSDFIYPDDSQMCLF